ncbi:hypothetical protein HD596_009075 [Nonomuraea jabiensis]|uniref:Uncharacterized protein n=1 Tax=Nonomuraea jabiensis TaxID=882448 RepID=A0A7W9GEG6_9ACTN|nr:hypothetical protein [Nonomuraea jabiensis]
MPGSVCSSMGPTVACKGGSRMGEEIRNLLRAIAR